MVLLKDVNFDIECSTSVVRGLDRQIIDEMNRIVPNALVSFADLNVVAGTAARLLLQPPAKEALRRAIKDRGQQLIVNSDYRTIAQQLLLYRQMQQRKCGITIAARPGRSNHQSGLALDVQDADGWEPYLEKYGWRRLLPSDPPHFDFLGGGTRDIRSTAVLAFQRLWNRNNPNAHIKEDGDFGPITEARLASSPVKGFGRFRTLLLIQPYLQGEDVLEVQQALVMMNYKVKADGIFGPSTDAAIKKFQESKGLAVDGVVGPSTREALGLRSEV